MATIDGQHVSGVLPAGLLLAWRPGQGADFLPLALRGRATSVGREDSEASEAGGASATMWRATMK